MKTQFKKILTFACVLLLHPMVNPGSFALARRKKPLRAYSFIAEGGKASQGMCDGETEVPRKLKKLPELAKANSYMGSEILSTELKGKNDSEMWKHYFRVKASCNVALEKTPSSIKEDTLKTIKKDLPPDDDSADDDEPERSDSQNSPDAE